MSEEYLADLAAGLVRLPRRDLPEALPATMPRGVAPGWTGPDEGWPPRPQGVTDLRPFEMAGAAVGFTQEELASRERALETTLADRRVRKELGARFAHVETDEV